MPSEIWQYTSSVANRWSGRTKKNNPILGMKHFLPGKKWSNSTLKTEFLSYQQNFYPFTVPLPRRRTTLGEWLILLQRHRLDERTRFWLKTLNNQAVTRFKFEKLTAKLMKSQNFIWQVRVASKSSWFFRWYHLFFYLKGSWVFLEDFNHHQFSPTYTLTCTHDGQILFFSAKHI